jgi:hypothetical protein
MTDWEQFAAVTERTKVLVELLAVTVARGESKSWKHSDAWTEPIEADRNYTPKEVGSILRCSYDTAIRRMQKMGGVDHGMKPTKRFARGKRMLRVSGRALREYLTNKKGVRIG